LLESQFPPQNLIATPQAQKTTPFVPEKAFTPGTSDTLRIARVTSLLSELTKKKRTLEESETTESEKLKFATAFSINHSSETKKRKRFSIAHKPSNNIFNDQNKNTDKEQEEVLYG
jgi:hypothetical protein